MTKAEIYNNLKQQQLQLDIDALEYQINEIELSSIIEDYDTSLESSWAHDKRQQSLAVWNVMRNLLGRDYLLNAQSNDETKELLNTWYDLNNKCADLKRDAKFERYNALVEPVDNEL